MSYLNKTALLSGKVRIDEAFVPVNKSVLELNPSGKKYRGTSHNQIIIACAIDSKGRRYAEAVGKGHITSKQCLFSYGEHIKKKSELIHDGIFSHDKLISELNLKSTVYKAVSEDSKKYMQPINSFISEIKRNFIIHQGSKNENIRFYLDWIVYKSSINNKNIDKKIELLEGVCFQNKVTFKVKDRYYR